MELNDLLREFGQQTGLGELALDENDACQIVFDDQYLVNVEASPGGERFFVHSFLCADPVDGREAFLAELLSANLFGQATEGASFGLDKNRGDIVLFRELVAEETDFQKFSSALEGLLNALEYWTNKTASGSAEEAGSAETAIESPGRPNEPMIRV